VKVWYDTSELEKDHLFYNLGAMYGEDFSRTVFVRGKPVGLLRPKKQETCVLSVLDAEEGEG